MSILKKLEMFRGITGYLGSGVFTPEGKMLGGVTDISGVSFEIAGSLFHDAFLIVNNKSREANFGYVNLVQMDTETHTVLCKCFNEGEKHFHVILVVKKNSNIAISRLMLKKVFEELKGEIK